MHCILNSNFTCLNPVITLKCAKIWSMLLVYLILVKTNSKFICKLYEKSIYYVENKFALI